MGRQLLQWLAAKRRHAEFRKSFGEAVGLVDTDSAAALAIFEKLSENGSAVAARWAGYLYEGNEGVEANSELAEEHYVRAIYAGSWPATITYARFLFNNADHSRWPRVLQDGIEKGYLPAAFWHGWYRFKLRPNSRTANEVRHDMQMAADAGHPVAKLMLARWTARGRFGLKNIPRGIAMMFETFDLLHPAERANVNS